MGKSKNNKNGVCGGQTFFCPLPSLATGDNAKKTLIFGNGPKRTKKKNKSKQLDYGELFL